MATAVLRSQDVLTSRAHMAAFRPNPSPAPPKSHSRRPTRPSPAASPSPPPHVATSSKPPRRHRANPNSRPSNRKPPQQPRGLVMEEIRILKRGEEVPPPPPPPHAAEASTATTTPIWSEPKKKLVSDPVVYAGPGFFASPEPSSLPFPAFFLKKAEPAAIKTEEAATRRLRCVLGIGGFA